VIESNKQLGCFVKQREKQGRLMEAFPINWTVLSEVVYSSERPWNLLL
jgi:hypothetical protein